MSINPAATVATAATAATAATGTNAAAGIYDSMTATGLLIARDGIVGPWEGATHLPFFPDLNDPDNLDKWSLLVRSEVIKGELLSRITFATNREEENTQIAVYHSEPAGEPSASTDQFQTTNKRLISFFRPGRDDFQVQLDLVRDYADLRLDRMAEILP